MVVGRDLLLIDENFLLPSFRFTDKDPKRQKYPFSGNFVDENILLKTIERKTLTQNTGCNQGD